MDRTDNDTRSREPWSGRRPANGGPEEPSAAGQQPPPPPPPDGEEPPPPPPSSGRMDFSPFFVLLDALRRAIPGDMQNQFTRMVRETLVTIRGLIDWYLDRLERPALEAGAAGGVGSHRRGQDYRPLLTAHADDHLEPDLLQVDVAALREGQRHTQRRPPVVARELL